MTEKYYLRVRHLVGGIQPVPLSRLKPRANLGTAVNEAREIAKGSNHPILVRILNESGRIKSTIRGDGNGVVTADGAV